MGIADMLSGLLSGPSARASADFAQLASRRAEIVKELAAQRQPDYIETQLAKLLPSAQPDEIAQAAAFVQRVIDRQSDIARTEGWQKGRDFGRGVA